MPRNGSTPSRNAATATSLAAFSTAGAVPPASPAARARRRHGKRLVVGLRELEDQAGGEVERRDRRRRAVRIGERVGDRDAHVRITEVRERGAVAEANQRVDDRGRVHDDLDPVVREVEQEMRLDQLEALVHQVAESIVIFGPIDHVGCASASEGVTWRELGTRAAHGTAPPTR